MADVFARKMLCDGSVITAAEGRSCLEVRQGGGGKRFRSLVLPMPNAGFGGGDLRLSPTERYVVLSIHSGQSEEGYALIDIDAFSLVGRQAYRVGGAASYGFSLDAEVLVMALPRTLAEWWSPWKDEDAADQQPASVSFHFGELAVHHIATGEVSYHPIDVEVPRDWAPDRVPWDPDLDPSFVTNDRFRIRMPWGRVELRLPLPEQVVLAATR